MARRKTLRIATFNVNGIGTRLPHLLSWLQREAPDVVALQELKAVDAAFPVDALERAGYGALWLGEARWNGVAILARDAMPIESRRRLPGEPAKVTVSVRSAPPGAPPELNVIDRGPGIPAPVAAQIFTPFYTTSEHGTGLGLYIARELAEANDAGLTLGSGAPGADFILTASQQP